MPLLEFAQDAGDVVGENRFADAEAKSAGEQAGGRLQVDSAPGNGTCVVVEVPAR